MSSIRVTANFRDNFGADLGTKLVTKDYLMSVYPNIAQQIGKTPELWTWGSGSNGRLGNGTTTGTISTPVTTFSGGTNWKQVSTGDRHFSSSFLACFSVFTKRFRAWQRKFHSSIHLN